MASVEDGHRITNDILQETIANELKVHKECVEVVGFKVSDGLKKGENFVCVMKAVEAKARINGSQELEFKYMAKCLPFNPVRKKACRDGRIIEKECQVQPFPPSEVSSHGIKVYRVATTAQEATDVED